MIVTTESGSVYEIDGLRVRRTNADAAKRGDDQWQLLRAVVPNPPAVGAPMWLVMDSLATYGPDDFGKRPEEISDTTTRRTTKVVSVDVHM